MKTTTTRYLPAGKKRTVAALKAIEMTPEKSDEVIWDEDVTGFGMRMRRSTADRDVIVRTWILDYRFHGKGRRLLIAGIDELAPAQALSFAMDKKAAVRLGTDPQAEREQKREENRKAERPHMFSAVVALYLDARATKVRESSLRDFRRYLTGPRFQRLHKMDVGEVTKRDVALCLNAIPQAQYITAKCARMALNRFYVWCMSQGIADANPCIGTVVEKPADYEPRGRVLTVEELAQIWRGCDDDEFGKIIRLLILLGARRQEIAGMCSSEFSPDRTVWTLPKARAKNNNPLTLELPPAAVRIIKSVKERVGRDQLFGNRGAGFGAWDRAKDRLDAKVKLASWRIHDLRRSAATGMADIGIAPHIVETILNHISGHKSGVAGLYNRSSYEAETRLALLKWANHIHETVNGDERKVVPLQRA
jgi:integrase